jgi:PAS domain S-box-containing protein/diguanylate cyclase (GGDEF)-like protein
MAAFEDGEIYRNMLENVPIALCVVDLQKRIVFWSSGAERLTSHLRHEVLGHSCVAEPLLHCDQPGCEFCDEHCPVACAMKTSQAVDSTGFIHHKNGHEIPVRIRAVPVYNRHRSIIGALSTFEELQAGISRERGEGNSSRADYEDHVTGVASRAMMQAHMQAELASLSQGSCSHWVFLVQVQGLAHFRASLGTEAASSLLRLMVRTVESCLWSSDLVGRWGDDQFLLLVDGHREEGIESLKSRIRKMLAAEGIEWWGERRSLPVLIVATAAATGDTVESVVQRLHKLLPAGSGCEPGNAGCAGGSAGS